MDKSKETSRDESTEDVKITNNDKQDKSEEQSEEEVLEGLPEEVKRVVQIGWSMQRSSGPLPPQFLSKLNEKHIDKILDLSEKDDDRTFKDIQSSKKYMLTYVLIFSALFVFLTLFLVNENIDLYKEILKLLVVFAGGLGSGYGLKTYMERRK